MSTGPYELPDYFATGEATAEDNCSDVQNLDQDPAPGTLLQQGTYIIKMTAEDGNGFEGECEFILVVDDVLGMPNNAEDLNTLSLFPNPARETVTLSNPNQLEIEAIKVYDIIGRLVFQTHERMDGLEQTIPLTTLQSGSYIVVIKTDVGQSAKQLIKE